MKVPLCGLCGVWGLWKLFKIPLCVTSVMCGDFKNFQKKPCALDLDYRFVMKRLRALRLKSPWALRPWKKTLLVPYTGLLWNISIRISIRIFTLYSCLCSVLEKLKKVFETINICPLCRCFVPCTREIVFFWFFRSESLCDFPGVLNRQAKKKLSLMLY